MKKAYPVLFWTFILVLLCVSAMKLIASERSFKASLTAADHEYISKMKAEFAAASYGDLVIFKSGVVTKVIQTYQDALIYTRNGDDTHTIDFGVSYRIILNVERVVRKDQPEHKAYSQRYVLQR